MADFLNIYQGNKNGRYYRKSENFSKAGYDVIMTSPLNPRNYYIYIFFVPYQTYYHTAKFGDIWKNISRDRWGR